MGVWEHANEPSGSIKGSEAVSSMHNPMAGTHINMNVVLRSCFLSNRPVNVVTVQYGRLLPEIKYSILFHFIVAQCMKYMMYCFSKDIDSKKYQNY
jgi:hypothetical protein